MATQEAQVKSKTIYPVGFDGPFKGQDFYGADYYVEVRFLTRKDAEQWMVDKEVELHNIEEYEKALATPARKGFLSRLLGLA